MDEDDSPFTGDELRALLRRVKLNKVEPGDIPKIKEILSRAIAEAEAAGPEGLLIELEDEES